jgi:quercetin dioxygenase-like cupin family protein
MPGSYLAFNQQELIDKYASGGAAYHEFLRRRGMSLGIYTLPAGSTDSQHPHTADEVYIVLQGRGTLRVVDSEIEVATGSIVSVDHGEDHQFIEITEDMQLLVVFAPPDLPDEG